MNVAQSKQLSSPKDSDANRFYRLNPDGKWQKKTKSGNYVVLNTKQFLKRLQMLGVPCSRRFE